MKRAKVMLSAIAVFAVLGGALAFKAHTNTLKVTYTYCNTVNSANTCATVAVKGTDIGAVTATNRDVTITSATLDANVTIGGACTQSPHPCTASVYYQSTLSL